MRNSNIYVTGDIHGEIDIDKLAPEHFKESKKLNKNDYVIIAGDFGCIWSGDKKDKQLLRWLQKRPFTTLFVDGNHENFALLNSFNVEKWNGGRIHRINEKVIHLMRGQVFNISGRKIFTFGGAASLDKAFRRESISWWKEELPSKDEMDEGISNLETNKWKVDIIISHTAPTILLEPLKNHLNYDLGSDFLTDYLNDIYKKVNFKKWYFGHFHIDEEINNKACAVYYDFLNL